jgi:histidinol-phosphate aminotransferase
MAPGPGTVSPVSSFRRPSLGPGFGYVPGEQPPDDAGWLKLNTNESPLPPSPEVRAALAAAGELRRYPHPFAEPLRSAIAEHHGVSSGEVIVGNGADQILDLCFRAFVDPGDAVGLTEPTYSLLPVLARLFSVSAHTVELADDGLPPATIGAVHARLRFLVNPNSPTGTWMPPAEVERRLGEAGSVLVIDEAYCDFAPESCIPLLPRHRNWLVVRTFSKSYGLAGLRVGYAIGAPELIADLAAVQDSYPVDRLAIAAATAALGDAQHHRRIVDTVLGERDRLARGLAALGWEVTPSHANFVLAKPPGDPAGIAEELREARILVRHFASGRYADRLRISVGAPDETDRLLAALDAGGHGTLPSSADA